MENNYLNENVETQIDNDMKLIAFALVPSRLVFLDDVKIWLDFHKEYDDVHKDWSIQQLHKYFACRILPRIERYTLNDSQLWLLNLLQLHPAFEEMDYGFKLKQLPITYFNESTIPIPEKHITIKPQINIAEDGLIEKPSLNKDNGRLSSPTMDICRTVLLTPQTSRENPSSVLIQTTEMKFSLETTCLFSFTLRTSDEVGQNIMLSILEIYKRLYHCKMIFEDNAKLPDTFTRSMDNLINTLKISERILKSLDQLGLAAINFTSDKRTHK